MTFFLTETELALPFFQYIPFFIQDIIVRVLNLEIEVRYVILDDLRGSSGLLDQVGVHPADDSLLIFGNE